MNTIKQSAYNSSKPGKPPVFTKEDVLIGELTELRSVYDVYYYDLTVDIYPDKKSISGKVEMYATATADLAKLQIDLHPNYSILRLIDKKSNQELPFRREERAIYVDIKKMKDEKFAISVEYQGKPVEAARPPWEGGFVWEEDSKGHPWIGVACESEGASIWWPLKDHTSDEPDSMRMHYKVPADLVAVGNGQLEGIDTTGNSCIYNWFISYPINTYNVTVTVGDFKKIDDTYIGITGQPLLMTHYVLKNHYKKAVAHFKQLHSMLRVFETKFGEYPFYRDGFKLIEAPFAGMEHQTAIAYGSKFRNNLYGIADHLMLHETVHEWWGNSVTAGDFADIWLQEGFATYSEVIYLEETQGKEMALRHLKRINFYIRNQYPLVGIEGRRWFDSYIHTDAYRKGAWVLHTLRNQIDNDSLFFDILKSFAENNKYQIVRSADFISLVNEKCKKDYSWFFDQYLYKRDCPALNYAITPEGMLYYQWANVPAEFNTFKIRLKSGNDDITIVPSSDIQIVQLPVIKTGKSKYRLKGNVLCNYHRDDSLPVKFNSQDQEWVNSNALLRDFENTDNSPY